MFFKSWEDHLKLTDRLSRFRKYVFRDLIGVYHDKIDHKLICFDVF